MEEIKKSLRRNQGESASRIQEIFPSHVQFLRSWFRQKKVHRRIYYVQINIIRTEGDSQRPQMVGVHLCTLVCTACTLYTDHNNKIISTKAREGRPLDPLIKCSKMLLLQYYWTVLVVRYFYSHSSIFTVYLLNISPCMLTTFFLTCLIVFGQGYST